MATTTSSRAAPPSRRSSSISSGSTPSSIARGATARSAVSPRVSASVTSPVTRRTPSKGKISPPPPAVSGETRESLEASLKQETEKKEELLVKLQNKDQEISNLASENDNLTSALNAAETRLAELYADQSRMEEEMAARIEVVDKLRTQVRDLEREKRDVQRRYNEQTATFEAERQAFYDNEQHLKSRIQSLSQARRQPQPLPTSPSLVSISTCETEVEDEPPVSDASKQDINDPEQEPAEMTALKLELSTLATSYTSLQSTLVLLQSQLVDLKRVNNELQEENESYNILLREKTLNGQFDVLRMGGHGTSEASGSEVGADDDGEPEARDNDSFRSRATGRSAPLDPVDELAEEQEHELDPEFEPEPRDTDNLARSTRKHSRKRGSSTSSHSPAPRGESLANLPITGPGLDLAAELGRAENKDILDGRASLDNENAPANAKSRPSKKASHADTGRKVSSASEGLAGSDSNHFAHDLDALRSEVKSLKDANKALSLYASKIIDRIISQEGFEHVLAVDYDKVASPTPPAGPRATTFENLMESPKVQDPPLAKKARPQSAMFSLSTSTSPANSQAPFSPPVERLTTFNSPPTPSTASPPTSSPPNASASTRASRRSLSFDWKSFSLFKDTEKKPDPMANLRPLTLRAGAPSMVAGARKLDTHEDEEDRRERERLNATMKLMGIEKPASPVMPSMLKSFSSPANPNAGTTLDPSGLRPPPTGTGTSTVPPTPQTRFSFFRRNSTVTANNSDSSSVQSSRQGSPYLPSSIANTPNLTQEALEQAEAENTLAALDAHERQLSAEIAKGAGGGFTEPVRRSGDRRSSRRSGSGSTVWSAGMSRVDDGED